LELNMSDSGHSGAVRLQAAALIAAALVTTAGAVTSAFIQTGWIKPTSIAVAVTQTESKPLATFTGMIEPVDSSSISSESFATNTAQTENRPATYQETLPTARLKSPPPTTYSQMFSAPGVAPAVNSRPMDAPRILSGTDISRPLMATGSWFNAITPSILTQPSQTPTIQNQTAVQNQSIAPRPSGRPTNWTPMSH
jgi:hypothetical protein